MDFLSILHIAIRALARNKLRSSLTMLGIIIGVGAVIAMVGVGQGAQQRAQEQIEAMGSNVLFVGSGSVNKGGQRTGFGGTKTLVQSDLDAILRDVPAIKTGAPNSGTSAQLVYENQNWSTRITGTTRLISTYAHGPSRRAPFSPTRMLRVPRTSSSSAKPFARTCLAIPTQSARSSASRTCRSA